jgi:hypothetical protein
MREKPKIPTEEEFTRANQKMRERSKIEAEFRAAILSRLSSRVPCHDIWVWLTNSAYTISFVFPKDADLESSHNDSRALIEAAVNNAADSIGVSEVNIEYHSHEYVLKKFNGNYGQYFR